MFNPKFHLPLWKTFRNEEVKRLYLRIEFLVSKNGASGGLNSDGSPKIYRRGVEFVVNISITHGKVKYSITYEAL